MNLKETIRAEVRNELKKVEAQCRDMAWLLHSLGIQVGSWPKPSPQEVGCTCHFNLLFSFTVIAYMIPGVL